MNTYKDPELQRLLLGKVAVSRLVLLIIVVMPRRATPGATTAPAEAPATPVRGVSPNHPRRLGATTKPVAEASKVPARSAPVRRRRRKPPATGATPAAGPRRRPVVESPVPMAAAERRAGPGHDPASGAVQAPAPGACEKDVAVSGTVTHLRRPSTSSPSAFSTTMGTPSDYQTHTMLGSHYDGVNIEH